jgi:hypothetical protein
MDYRNEFLRLIKYFVPPVEREQGSYQKPVNHYIAEVSIYYLWFISLRN